MKSIKSAYIVQEPGLYPASVLAQSLESLGYKVGSGPLKQLQAASLVVLRGPWTPKSEEMLLAHIYAQALDSHATTLINANTRILGIGRGALVLALSRQLKVMSSKFQWSYSFEGEGPWVKTALIDPTKTAAHEFYSHLMGRALPLLPPQNDSSQLRPWLKVGLEKVVGWISNDSRFMISFVDPCALEDRSQLPEYGYADLSAVKTQTEILDLILHSMVT